MTDITKLSDRSLLEAAAKFCGYGVIANHETALVLRKQKNGPALWWSSLTDAGDRARMCDENAIDIEHDTDIGFVIAWHDGKSRSHSERYADYTNNRTLAANYAATRLAARLWIERQEGK